MLLRHLKRYLPLYLLAALSIGSANVIYAFFPRVLGDFTNLLEKRELTLAGVGHYAYQLMWIGIGYGVLFGLGQYTNHRLGRIFEFTTRERLFGQFTRLSEQYYSGNGIGKLLSYVMNDVTAVRESIANGLNQLTNATVLLVSSIAMMLLVGIPPYLMLLSVLPLLAIPLLVVYFGPRIRQQSQQVQESLAAMTESAEEQFGGMKVTKTFAAEDVAKARFGRTVDRITGNQLLLVKLSSMFQAALPFSGALSLVIAMTFGGVLVIQGKLPIGHFVALTLYLRLIMTPLQQIGNVINTVQRSRASLQRLNALLAAEPHIKDAEDAEALPEEPSELELHGLTYCYPGTDRPVLRNVSFRVEKGRTLGIVGHTGSGKTTLMKLLLRVYDPPEGTVYIEGMDVRKVTLASLRSSIGYVPQDGFLFSTTIRENIAFYKRPGEIAEVEEAARLASVYEDIKGFDQQFETKLGERGLTLSGGQRQRTSLARGLIKRAPILLLDDSVSAVDTVTETAILRNLQQTRNGKTTVIIAHRISAVMHADQIIVLDKGEIVERGTHAELLALNGYYASLYVMQGEGTAHEG